MRPICVACSTEMDCLKNGALVHLIKAGMFMSGDLYGCPKCGNKIVTGFGKKAFSWGEYTDKVVAEL